MREKGAVQLLAIFKDEYKADFIHGPLALLDGLSEQRRSLIVALRELEVAREIQVERHLVPLVRYPGMPFIRENEDDLEARVCVAIEDGNCRGQYRANERWSAYQYLKAHNPESRIRIFRNYRGGNRLRFFVEPDARYAAASAPIWLEDILRWVVDLRSNHLLVVSGYDPGALAEADEETQRLAHTITFSVFAREYLGDLFAADPLSDYPRNNARAVLWAHLFNGIELSMFYLPAFLPCTVRTRESGQASGTRFASLTRYGTRRTNDLG